MSLYEDYNKATLAYYGTDEDPLKYPPVVTDKEVAHEIALYVESMLDRITDDRIESSAAIAQQRYSFGGRKPDIEALKADVLNREIARVVVNAELMHARKSPGDFNAESKDSSAYQMATNYAGEIVPVDERQQLREQ